MSVRHERRVEDGRSLQRSRDHSFRLRQTKRTLPVGAELAEQNDETLVTDAHIEAARDRVQRGRLENKI